MKQYLLTVTRLLAVLLTVVSTAGCSDAASDDEERALNVVTFTATAAAMTRHEDGAATRAVTVPAGDLSLDETFRVAATKTRDGVITTFIPDDGTTNIVSYGLVFPDTDSDNGLLAWRTAGGYVSTTDYTYDFYAVWPATAPAMQIADDCSTVSLSLDSTCPVDGDTDYLTAVSDRVRKNAQGIPLSFRHAMSKVTFRLDESIAARATVRSIKLQHINACGTYDFVSGNWSSDTPADYLMELETPLLLMPQTMDKDACAVVEFRLQAEDGTYLRGSADEWATTTIPLKRAWQPGVSYVMTLTAATDEIRVVTTIIDWDTAVDEAFPDSYI